MIGARFIRAKGDSTASSMLSEGPEQAGWRVARGRGRGKEVTGTVGSPLPLLPAPPVASLMGTLRVW